MLSRIYFIFFLGLFSLPAVASETGNGEPEMDPRRFSTGVTGSMPAGQQWTHSSMLKYVACQELFLAISQQPRSKHYIDQALQDLPFGLEEILQRGLLREDQGLFYLNFNFLTKEDQKLIYEVSSKYGHSLTQAYAQQWQSFQTIFEGNTQKQISEGFLAYILIGLFSLDWDGLDLTKEMGLRHGATHVEDPDNIYTPWAKEKGDPVYLKELYWGSHNDDGISDEFVFSTFGDHAALPRRAMPDIYWTTRIELIRADQDLKKSHLAAMKSGMNTLYRQYGELLVSLKSKAHSAGEIAESMSWNDEEVSTHLAYLVDIQVLTKDENQYIAALPVLGQSDLEMVNKVRQLSWDIMKAWLTENYASIEAELKDLPAVSQGVPFEVMFTEVWHYIFGLTNRDLVAAGFFQDPYGQDRLHKGYMPSIWSKGLYDDFNPN